MKKNVVVIGASGFGRECLDVLQALQNTNDQIRILGVLDDFPSPINLARLNERSVAFLGGIDDWLREKSDQVYYVLGIGSPSVRKRLVNKVEKAGLQPLTVVHPSATIGSNTRIESGVVICAGVAVSTNVSLGKHVHLNPNSTIGHDSVIEDFVSINPGAIISGEVNVRTGVLVGAAALVLQQLELGEETLVGAGAVVTKNVPSKVLVKGVPGRWE